MENAVIERIKNHSKNLQTLFDEIRLQMALGKAEARDLMEKEKKNLSAYIKSQKKEISKVESISVENRRRFLAIVEDLESSLNTPVPVDSSAYDEYKSQILNRIYKLEEQVRKNYTSMSQSMQDNLDSFKAKMDAFRLNIALHDKDDPDHVARIKSDFTKKLEETRKLLSDRESAQSRLDSFVEDISESFNYLKRAISDLSR